MDDAGQRQDLVTQSGTPVGWVLARPENKPMARPSVLTIGQFDGVHLGHQALLRETLRKGRRVGEAVVGAITFDRHPQSLLAPARAPLVLTRLDDKVRLLFGTGVDFVVVLRLSHELLNLTAQEFVDDVLVSKLACRTAVVGPNFRFGRGAAGDTHFLDTYGSTCGLEVVVPELTRYDGRVVSSTAVRAAVVEGSVEMASWLLGRPHFAVARVSEVRGPQLRVAPPGNVALPRAGTFSGYVGTLADGDQLARWPAEVRIRGTGTVAVSPELPDGDTFSAQEVSLHFVRKVADGPL